MREDLPTRREKEKENRKYGGEKEKNVGMRYYCEYTLYIDNGGENGD